jgi:ribosomal protein L11 methyltransferase
VPQDAAAPAEAAYWVVTATLAADAPEASEAVTNYLWELGAVGVVEEAGPAGPEVRGYFPPGRPPAELGGRLRGYLAELAALAIPVGSAAVAVAPLAEEPWADAWRAHFVPVAVGQRLLVCAPWAVPDGDPAPAGRIALVIEPGRAFGTGSHGSTRTCLELLERVLAAAPVARALDVGAGSGILAIAAARLGAGHVDALDVDPDAVGATEENARRNGVADRVRAALAEAERWEGPPAPLVLANLLASAHAVLAPRLVALTTPGGALVAGGLLVHEVPAIAGAFAAAGCELVEVAEHEGWAALLLRRAAAPPGG